MNPSVERFLVDGRFSIDGIGLEELGQQSTPCYVYSAGTIRAQYARLRHSFPGFDTCYSFKANPNPTICRLLSGLGAGAEISSSGELRTALDAGYAPDDIIFVGPAKTRGEIEFAVRTGIHAIVADSAEELRVIEQAAGAARSTQRVLLRINTLEQPSAREAMVGGPSKFGFDEETVVEQVRGLELLGARLSGIQVYSASQVLDPAFLSAHFGYVLELAFRLSGELDFPLDTIDFGGGFGVPYAEDETELDLAPVAAAAARLLHDHGDRLRGCRLVIESGRFLVAGSGVFLARVLRIKESRGETFVLCDAGMNAFSRPVFMRVCHPIRILDRLAEPADVRCNVCGPVCTPIDCIGSDVPLPSPRPGDTIGVFNAGAYGWSMSLKDFMSLSPPVELLADEGGLTAIR